MPPPGRGIPTVQETLSAAIAVVVGHPISLVGASRTDAGVHARGQVAHFDALDSSIPAEGIRRSVNHHIPDDILIRSMEAVEPSFDAITSARSKRYQYYIWSAPDRNPMAPDLSWHRWRPLDISVMQAAAARFEGEHDFASFARPDHGRDNTVRRIDSCTVVRRGPRLVIGVEGSGFLWNMVRIMVGTIVEAGRGLYQPSDVDTMLAARDRRAAGPTAPPHGLYLQWVRY